MIERDVDEYFAAERRIRAHFGVGGQLVNTEVFVRVRLAPGQWTFVARLLGWWIAGGYGTRAELKEMARIFWRLRDQPPSVRERVFSCQDAIEISDVLHTMDFHGRGLLRQQRMIATIYDKFVDGLQEQARAKDRLDTLLLRRRRPR